MILELLRESIGRDDLIRESKLNTKDANALFSMMEIKQLIKEKLGEIKRA
jgi:hypothetical protein